MNKNKYKYTYKKIDNRFKLQVNPEPAKRNDFQVTPELSMHNGDKQNFLYALCPHASAATAALHIISAELFNTSVHPSSSSSSSVNDSMNPLLETTSTKPIYYSKTGSEQRNNNAELLSKSGKQETEKQKLKRRNSEEMGSAKRTS
jgi:hypothetical protein